MVNKVHEGYLEGNSSRIYLGTVIKVARAEEDPITDYVNNTLNPKEIIFSVGSIITEAVAVPLDLVNEVNVGDQVLIFSMELVFNSTFLYHPIRYNNEDNTNLTMKYGNSEITFIPRDSSSTDLKLAGGKSVISFNTSQGTLRLDSDDGGIGINSQNGLLDIRNNNTSLKDILIQFVDAVRGLTVLTTNGPAPLTPVSISDMLSVSMEIVKLLGTVSDTSLFPHVPADTWTVDFAAEAVSTLGVRFLNDEEDDDSSPSITALQEQFPEDDDVEVNDPNGEIPIISTQAISSIPRVFPDTYVSYSSSDDVQLSPNFWLSNLTTKCTFPHVLKAQRDHTKDELVHNLQIVALNLLEPLKAQFPTMRVNSGFRGKPSLSGGRISQHEIGQAIDIQFPGFSYMDYFNAAEWVVQNLAFDQFIFEHGNSIWFHISCKNETKANRAKTLTMLKGNYESGIKLYYL